MAVQYCASEEEKWVDKMLHRFQKPQPSLPKGRIPAVEHGHTDRFCTGNAMFSFLDGFSGYNQIRMAPRDAEKTTFWNIHR